MPIYGEAASLTSDSKSFFDRFWGSHESIAPMAGHLCGQPGIRLAPALRPAAHDAIAWRDASHIVINTPQ